MRILIVDDHPAYRRGLKDLIESELPQALHGVSHGTDSALKIDEAGNCAEAIERFSGVPFDIVTTDLMMPGLRKLQAVSMLRPAFPESRLLVITAVESNLDAKRATDMGADGYQYKKLEDSSIVEALVVVSLGGTYFPPDVKSWMRGETAQMLFPPPSSELARLSRRETEVFALLVSGMSNKQIAGKLNIAESTVKQHVSRIFESLGVQRRAQAVLIGAQIDLANAY